MPTAKAEKMTVRAKMVEVMKELDGHEPSGKNSHFRYDYWETNQISGIFRPLFAKHGLAFLADVLDVDIREKGKNTLTTMKVRFTIMDIEPDGAEVSGVGVGQGEDNSDKGANKAFSGAMKYWLLKTFLLGGEDAENDAMETRTQSRATQATIEDSNVEGIQRGGRSTAATVTQVDQVRMMARSLGYDPYKMNGLFETVFEFPLDLPKDDITEAGAQVRTYLDTLSADDIGKLIQYMQSMLPDEPSA
jgi:hypothetical protein